MTVTDKCYNAVGRYISSATCDDFTGITTLVWQKRKASIVQCMR